MRTPWARWRQRNKLRLSDIEIMQVRTLIRERSARSTEWVGRGPARELTVFEVEALRGGLAAKAKIEYAAAQAEVLRPPDVQCDFIQTVQRVGDGSSVERCVWMIGHAGGHETAKA